MSKAQKQWAKQARARLVVQLGGKCCDCGATADLQFDCRVPCGDEHHGMDTSARMSFYHAQFRKANLALRCSKCNSAKGALPEGEWLFRLQASRRRAAGDDGAVIITGVPTGGMA